MSILADEADDRGQVCEDSPRPPPNGCGGGPTQSIIPNEPFGFAFENCCNDHDVCYAKCRGPDRKICDGDFLECLKNTCQQYLIGGVDLYRLCAATAATYYVAVRISGAPFFLLARRGCCD